MSTYFNKPVPVVTGDTVLAKHHNVICDEADAAFDAVEVAIAAVPAVIVSNITKAQEYAMNPEDVLGSTTGVFSALHYAAKANGSYVASINAANLSDTAANTAIAARIAADAAKVNAEAAQVSSQVNATASATSATASATSATAAATSEASTATLRGQAATSETNALNSATAAATSETNALNSATAAATSETNVAASAASISDQSADIALNTADRHSDAHTVASHSDTTMTGAQANELVQNTTATILHKHLPPGLEGVIEGGNTGWRLAGRNPSNYGDIGDGAVDFSYSQYASDFYGARGEYSFAANYNTIASGAYSSAFGYKTHSAGTTSFAANYDTSASGAYSSAFGYKTRSDSACQFSAGKYNIGKTTTYFEVGCGTNTGNRKNVVDFYSNGSVGFPEVVNQTTDPHVAGILWHNAGVLMISLG